MLCRLLTVCLVVVLFTSKSSFCYNNSGECTSCLNGFNIVRNVFRDSNVPALLSQGLNCQQALPAAACDRIVEAVHKKIVEVVEKMDVATFCGEVANACPPFQDGLKTKSRNIKQKLTALHHQLNMDSDSKCYLCRIVINYGAGILNENVTAQLVEKALDDACSLLPGGTADLCKRFVYLYTPELMAILVSDVNTEEICQSIGFCTKTSVPTQVDNLPKETVGNRNNN